MSTPANGRIPVPDPSVLTTDNLRREIEKLSEMLSDRIVALRELQDEKFRSVQTQFIERDVRVEQTARDTRVAVDAALQAAEKAVGKQNESFALSIAKSETATIKQIDQQGMLILTTTSALDSKINDVKDRLTRIEGQGVGKDDAATTQHASSSLIVAIIAVGVALLSAVAAIAVLIHPVATIAAK